MRFYTFLLVIYLAAFSPTGSSCQMVPEGALQSQKEIMAQAVAEQRTLYGLASFYNHVSLLAYENEEWQSISPPYSSACIIAARGRFETLIAGPNATMLEGNRISSDAILRVKEGDLIGPVFGSLRYLTLPPLAWLSQRALTLLAWIQSLAGWGIAIMLLALLIRVAFHPLTRFMAHTQSYISKQQALLAPRIKDINYNFKGEDAHIRTMAAYADLGISPFFKLRASIGPLLQIPVMIAVFTMLGNLEALRGESFLWINDLSMPDHVALLPKAVPFLGDRVSLLPLIMTSVSLMHVLALRNFSLTPSDTQIQRRNLIWLALLFLVLFYPFPSAMVLYWTTSNLIQLVERRFLINDEQ